GFGDRLRLEFEMRIHDAHLSALLVWRPVVGIDLRSPLEELRQIVDFLLAQVELRHRATPRGAQRLRLHPGAQEGLEGRILTATRSEEHTSELQSRENLV